MTLVVVSGAIANKLNQGGEAWVRLSYLLGLRRLGFHVHFVEQIREQDCVDAVGAPAPFEISENRVYFERVMDQFALSESSTLLPVDARGIAAIPSPLLDVADSASFLLNISGHLSVLPLFARFRRKVFVDIDPGFTHFWHAAGNVRTGLAGHDQYFTIAENIGQSDCNLPKCDIAWQTTRPPVVLDEWPVVPPREDFSFTTVANWRGSFGPIVHDGVQYGLKVHEFRKFFPLPARSSAPFEIALNIHTADHRDLEALRANGWHLADPIDAAGTPDRFRQYVQKSSAEFSVAQGIYVQTRSGWFSDRTTRYLASGRPVLIQDTGFTRHLPAEQGIVAFSTLDGAVTGAEGILANYEAHSRAAREIAKQYFDSDVVLTKLLENINAVF